MSQQSILLAALVLGTVVLTLVGLGMLMLFRQYGQTHAMRYDTEKQRVELEMLRKTIEGHIYRLEDRLTATESRWRDMNHLVLSAQSRQPEIAPAGVPSSLEALGISPQSIQLQRDLVFVLIPFHPEFQAVFEAIVRACRDVGLRALRGDEEFVQGEVFPHILRLIAQARLAIAVLDGRNPNVFYELGLAQAMGKQTLLVARSPEEAPFDVRTKRLVVYRNPKDLHRQLSSELARVLAHS